MKEGLESVRRGAKAITTLKDPGSELLILVDPTKTFCCLQSLR